MQWSVVGWSHHHSPIEVREQLAFTKQEVVATLDQFRKQFPDSEAVLLSTCNRVEFYCASRTEHGVPSIKELGEFITSLRSVQFDDIVQQAIHWSQESMLKHLFTVAASLDSMIIGEAQILSQVKEAYELACEAGATSTLMHRAFQRAVAVAKRVATETQIHRKRISVPSVAVSQIAQDFFERFDNKNILLIGAGEMGMETLQYLIDAGAKSIDIINRSHERAEELARKFLGNGLRWEQLDEAIANADLIVSTTSATEPIVTAETMRKIQSRRSTAVLILDLAVPRDFEPQVGDVSDVYLYTVDDLQEVCDRNLELRKKEWPRAQEIVEEETQRFLSETTHHTSGPTIKRLRDHASEIKNTELDRLVSRLKNKTEIQNLDERVERELKMALDRVVNKILHPPMQSLKEHADSHQHAQLLEALRSLFRIDD